MKQKRVIKDVDALIEAIDNNCFYGSNDRFAGVMDVKDTILSLSELEDDSAPIVIKREDRLPLQDHPDSICLAYSKRNISITKCLFIWGACAVFAALISLSLVALAN